jgi:hypothetical protein
VFSMDVWKERCWHRKEAEELACTKALYRLHSDLPLYNRLPAPFKRQWLDWKEAEEREKEEARRTEMRAANQRRVEFVFAVLDGGAGAEEGGEERESRRGQEEEGEEGEELREEEGLGAGWGREGEEREDDVLGEEGEEQAEEKQQQQQQQQQQQREEQDTEDNQDMEEKEEGQRGGAKQQPYGGQGGQKLPFRAPQSQSKSSHGREGVDWSQVEQSEGYKRFLPQRQQLPIFQYGTKLTQVWV